MFLSNDRGSGSSTPSYANDHSIFTSDTRPPPPPNFNNDVSLLNSKLDPPPPPFFPFYHYPSSTFAEHDHTQLLVSGHLLPQHQLTANTNLISEVMIDMAVSDKKSTNDVNPSNHHNYCASTAIAEKQNPQKKRSVKRDRHSKITTAQGVRDRRMRLSLDVAREFFGLQDLRGDDKPSKTIRWLLNQCKGPMKELARAKELKTKHNGGGGGGSKSTVSSTSECEVMSGIEENSNAGDISEKKAFLAKRRKRQPRKTNFHSIGKESREKARARARERTIEKIRGRESSSPSETGEESGISHSHEMKFSMAEVAVVKEPSSHFIGLQRPNQNGIEEAAVMTTSINSSPSSIFSFQPETAISQGLVCSNNNNNNNNVSSYFVNWDIDSTRAHYYYPSTTGNIQDRISSSILTTSEIHLPCHFSEVPNFGAKPNWEV